MPATERRQVRDLGSFRPSKIATLRSWNTRAPGLMDPILGRPLTSVAYRSRAVNSVNSVAYDLFGPAQVRSAIWVSLDLSRVALERTDCDAEIAAAADQGNRTLLVPG